MKTKRVQVSFQHSSSVRCWAASRASVKLLALALGIGSAAVTHAQWVAFNDHAPEADTHVDATRYHVFTNGNPDHGPLRSILNGANLPVTLSISRSGSVVAGGGVGGAIAGGTLLEADHYENPESQSFFRLEIP